MKSRNLKKGDFFIIMNFSVVHQKSYFRHSSIINHLISFKKITFHFRLVQLTENRQMGFYYHREVLLLRNTSYSIIFITISCPWIFRDKKMDNKLMYLPIDNDVSNQPVKNIIKVSKVFKATNKLA